MAEQLIDGSGEAVIPARYAGSGDRGRDVLDFVAGHPVVLASHVARLLDLDAVSAATLLKGVCARGWLRMAGRFRHQPTALEVTLAGLRELGSELPAPVIDLRRYWRDIAAVALSVGARRGVFGEIDRVYTRREMQAADRQSSAAGPLDGAGLSAAIRAKAQDRLFQLGISSGRAGGGDDGYWPDLVLVLPEGRVAFEIHLDAPDPPLLDAVLKAYRAKPSVAVVVLLTEDPSVGERLHAAAVRHGEDLFRVKSMRLGRPDR